MTAATVTKDVYRIRFRKSGKGYTFRCSCREFGRRKTVDQIIRAGDDHARRHTRVEFELGALTPQ